MFFFVNGGIFLDIQSKIILWILFIGGGLALFIGCYARVKREYDKYGLEEDEYLPTTNVTTATLKEIRIAVLVGIIMYVAFGVFWGASIAKEYSKGAEKRREAALTSEEKRFREVYGDYFGKYSYDELTDEDKAVIIEYHDSEYINFKDFIKDKYSKNKK